MSRWSRSRGPLPRAVARAVAALVGLALVLGVVRANTRYLYCPFMEAVVDRACCPGEARPTDDATGPSVDVAECCEVKHLGALPSAAVAPAPDVPAAPLLGLLPAVASLPTVSPRPPPLARERDARQQAPRPPGAARARTMVFLI